MIPNDTYVRGGVIRGMLGSHVFASQVLASFSGEAVVDAFSKCFKFIE